MHGDINTQYKLSRLLMTNQTFQEHGWEVLQGATLNPMVSRDVYEGEEEALGNCMTWTRVEIELLKF